jgi:hypothetical protein
LDCRIIQYGVAGGPDDFDGFNRAVCGNTEAQFDRSLESLSPRLVWVGPYPPDLAADDSA